MAAINRPEDVNAVAVTRFAIALVILCVVALLILAMLFNYFLHREQAKAPETANVAARRLPPEPRLQSHEYTDMKQMRAGEDQILGSYAWLDKSRGVVRIPIDRAIDILAQRGLPARSQAPPASDVTMPTDSSLGKKP